MMKNGRNDSAECNAPAVDRCRFIITADGTAVYGPDGKYLGLYETEDAAVEMIRLNAEQSGGNYNAI
jgi:hypothetical protein